jgi:hypothetical protein
MAALAHAADRNLPRGGLVADAQAGCRRASTGFSLNAEDSPANTGRQQRGDGQNGQESGSDAHVFVCKLRDLLYQILFNPIVGFGAVRGGSLGGKGVRRGKRVFELAAKGTAQHLGGTIAALAGSEAVSSIGLRRELL